MNAENFALACRFLPASYIEQGKQSKRSHENCIKILLEHKKLPAKGWDRSTIEMLLKELSMMDSNNFLGNAGVGEREGRLASAIVNERHFGMAHGIGRSGDITAIQPKAAGSSLMMKLTNSLVLDAVRIAGVRSASSCVVVPMATGMSLVLTFLTLKQMRPEAKYVIWPRVDQKSCFKAILTAGYEPIVVENLLVEDELRTDIDTIEEHLKDIPAKQILCIYTTTSCFAPRAPDSLEAIGKLCKDYDVPHVVNNAYGLQSSKCAHLIEQAVRSGRLDVFVQSTDKNFMVPVGGAIIAGFDDKIITKISQTYPGRASSAPIVDLFVTLLSMGVEGYKDFLIERKGIYRYLQKRLQQVATAHGERTLITPNNTISIGMTLTTVEPKMATELGSMLFTRNVSGARAVAMGVSKQIGPNLFENYGSHSNIYPCAYLTVAAAIGMKKEDVNVFARRLDRVFRKIIRRTARKSIDRSTDGRPNELDIVRDEAKWNDVSSQEEDNGEVSGRTHVNRRKLFLPLTPETPTIHVHECDKAAAYENSVEILSTEHGSKRNIDSSEDGTGNDTKHSSEPANPDAADMLRDSDGNVIQSQICHNIENDDGNDNNNHQSVLENKSDATLSNSFAGSYASVNFASVKKCESVDSDTSMEDVEKNSLVTVDNVLDNSESNDDAKLIGNSTSMQKVTNKILSNLESPDTEAHTSDSFDLGDHDNNSTTAESDSFVHHLTTRSQRNCEMGDNNDKDEISIDNVSQLEVTDKDFSNSGELAIEASVSDSHHSDSHDSNLVAIEDTGVVNQNQSNNSISGDKFVNDQALEANEASRLDVTNEEDFRNLETMKFTTPANDSLDQEDFGKSEILEFRPEANDALDPSDSSNLTTVEKDSANNVSIVQCHADIPDNDYKPDASAVEIVESVSDSSISCEIDSKNIIDFNELPGNEQENGEKPTEAVVAEVKEEELLSNPQQIYEDVANDTGGASEVSADVDKQDTVIDKTDDTMDKE